MNCLYITIFFNSHQQCPVTISVQTFIKSWNQLLYPWVIEVCCHPYEPCHDFFLHLIIVVKFFSQQDVSLGEEFTTPLRHILPIHNVTINSNNLFVNFRWTFTICIEKSYDEMYLAFGGTLDRHCHFKHISLKQSRFYHCQMSMAHSKRIKVDSSVAIISIKNFSIGLHMM